MIEGTSTFPDDPSKEQALRKKLALTPTESLLNKVGIEKLGERMRRRVIKRDRRLASEIIDNGFIEAYESFMGGDEENVLLAAFDIDQSSSSYPKPRIIIEGQDGETCTTVDYLTMNIALINLYERDMIYGSVDFDEGFGGVDYGSRNIEGVLEKDPLAEFYIKYIGVGLKPRQGHDASNELFMVRRQVFYEGAHIAEFVSLDRFRNESYVEPEDAQLMMPAR